MKKEIFSKSRIVIFIRHMNGQRYAIKKSLFDFSDVPIQGQLYTRTGHSKICHEKNRQISVKFWVNIILGEIFFSTHKCSQGLHEYQGGGMQSQGLHIYSAAILVRISDLVRFRTSFKFSSIFVLILVRNLAIRSYFGPIYVRLFEQC